MFRFANIQALWLLLLIPLLIVVFIHITHRKHKQLQAFGDEQLIKNLMPNASRVRPVLKFCFNMLALLFLILAIARPQYGEKEEIQKRNGIKVMFALDVSNSMLAEDVAPNRLERAKQIFSKLIDNMQDDKVGLVVFAGEAYTQLPITCDYVSAKMFLQSISPDLIKTQGTVIGRALQTSMQAFGEKDEASRVIILITDGEDHDDNAEAIAQQIKEQGAEIIVVGIGKPEGSPIPVPGTTGFRKDRQGNVVVSRLNEEMCRSIAKAGGGIYVRCDNTNTAKRVIENRLNDLATAELEAKVLTNYNEQYQTFVAIALLILIVDFFIFNRKNKRLSQMNIFGEKRNNTKTL